MLRSLAWHFQEAGTVDQAVGYLHEAGERAAHLSANQEAITHFTKALALLNLLPDSPQHAQQELALQIGLAISLLAIRGYGDGQVGAAYTRAQELCQKLGETPQLFPVLWLLALFNASRGEHENGRRIMEDLFSLGERTGEPVLQAVAHWGLGWHQFFTGDPIPARSHLEYMIRFYDPAQHHSLAFTYGQDPGITCTSCVAAVLWVLGYPQQALEQGWAAINLARQLSDDYGLALALTWMSLLQAFCRDFDTVHDLAEQSIRLSTEHGFSYWLAAGAFCRGWALSAGTQVEAGIAGMRQSLTAALSTGVKILSSHQFAELAVAYAKIGQVDQGLSLLKEALEEVQRSGERYYEAEIYRLMGELLLMKHEGIDESDVEGHFRRAIEVARQQNAKSWELRATMSLCCLLQQQLRLDEAQQQLTRIYGWFTEGFDTPDLRDAKVLLDELTSRMGSIKI